MFSDLIKASVIVPTYNGALKICGVLDALEKQTSKQFEIIVVVDGSTDDTVDILNNYNRKFKNINIVVQANGGRSVARNRGAEQSRGEFLIFYDDDMIPAPESVARHLSLLEKDPNLLIGGNMIDVEKSLNTDIQNYKANLSRGWIASYKRDLNELDFDTLFFSSANCSVSKSLFMRLGGFDERLKDAEDYDIAFRALQNKMNVVFDKTNLAEHIDKITCKSYIRRLRQYQEAHNKLAELHPERINRRRHQQPHLVKRMIYRLFAFPFLVTWIDRDFFLFMPKSLRYVFYRTVIHSMANVFPQVKI